MITARAKELVIVVCLSATLAFINGCAGKASPIVDVKTAGDSILNARESLAVACSEEAQEFAPQEFAHAENTLGSAQEALRKGKTRTAADAAFQAGTEARAATAITREIKAKHRGAEVRKALQEIIWETKVDQAASAEARCAIAEKTAIKLQKETKQARAQADEQIRRSKVELAIAKAELAIDSAEQAKAPGYADEAYGRAKASIQAAKSALDAGDFQNATTVAEEAFRYAVNASVQAMAKRESELEESLRGRDRTVATMTKVQESLTKAKQSLVGQYAEDMYEEAEGLLNETRLALGAKEYDRAESLAQQALVSASSALTVGAAKERETQVREAQEDAHANSLDAVAKAKRSLAEAQMAGALELAGDTYRKSAAALQRAEQEIQNEDFDKAVSLARESVSHSVTALTMAEAKTDRLRKIEEIEKKIMEEMAKIPEALTRKTNRGVVVSMGGALFAKGSSQIKDDAKARLKTVAEILKKYPDYKIVIEGHTDSIGSDESNLTISRERAYNFLMHMTDREDIPLERLSSVGYGESRPIASNINEEGRKQNRRVDIVILTAPVSP